VILVAAFLGSWLAFRVNARRTAVSIPEITETEVQAENVAASPEAVPAETPPIKHAFDFDEDQVTMILEMPTALLADDRALADGWVDVVSWARMAWQDIQEGKLIATGQAGEKEIAALDESEITREHLEGSLQRLHDAAERRRELRMKLAERQNGTSQRVTEG
jgi:hypothetical protein